MYKITFNDYVIYDPRLKDYIIVDPNVHLGVGEAGSVGFSIFHDHPAASNITKMKGVLELSEDGVIIYRGRVIKDTENFNKVRRIETEGLLACLNDSTVPPHSFPEDFVDLSDYKTAAESGNVVEYYLNWVLSQHNSQVSEAQKIKLGVVSVTDPSNYISRSISEYTNTWTFINDKFPKSSLGGYLLQRYEDDGVYLDYYSELPLTNTQTVEYAENLIDLVSELDATKIHTVIIPVGADGLTIDSLPDGDVTSDIVKEGKTLYSKSGVNTYGKITRIEKWNDVTIASNLQSKAAELLSQEGLAQTISIKACDLHSIDNQTISFRVGRNTRLISAPHDFSAVYPLMSLDINLFNPGATKITLGKTETTQTGISQSNNADLADKLLQQQFEIGQRKSEIKELKKTTIEQITLVIQNSEAIIFQALKDYTKTGDFETFKESISTQFAQTASKFEMLFNNVSEKIENVNGDLQEKYNERYSFIRFEDGNIILGESKNEITLTIEPDRIVFKQNGRDVAWFEDTVLRVAEAEFVRDGAATGRVKIGEFSFIPGVNGNLSFKKVGEV